MTRRAVPVAHGMIPMHESMDRGGEWKRRMTCYPHSGDCYPAGDIVLPGEEGRVIVYVCRECEAAKKEWDRKPR